MCQRTYEINTSSFNPWITEQKPSKFYGIGYILYHYFLNYLHNNFYKLRLLDAIEVKMLLLFKIFILFYNCID
jgi:hypothetical protein